MALGRARVFALVLALARVFAAGFFFAGAFLTLMGAFLALADVFFIAAFFAAALVLASAMILLLIEISEHGAKCGVEN
jgi:hypothetical protein